MKVEPMKNIGLLVIAAACMVATSVDAAPKKKVIGCGWGFNTATVDDFLAHADLFNDTGLDGVLVWLRGNNKEGRPVGMRAIYDQDWTYEAFSPMIPKLREMTHHKAVKENFLITMRSPRAHKEWTDDKRKWMDTTYVQSWEESGDWRRGFITVRAPFSAKNLHLHLGVSLAPGEKCWFDSIEIIPLD